MILIAEDDAVTSAILQAALQRLRLPSVIAATGAQAMEILETVPIDLVIVDLYLPDMVGLDLVQAIRNRPHVADLPLMCCTADSSIQIVTGARDYGVADFLAKPISVIDFSRRIQQALRTHSPRWEVRDQYRRRFESQMASSLLELTAKAVDSCIAMLEGDTDDVALDQELRRTCGAAEQVGALRLAHQIQRLWPSERESLLVALRIERTAIGIRAPLVAKRLVGFSRAKPPRAVGYNGGFSSVIR